MMQKDFIFLLIFWSFPFFSGNTSNTLQYQLGHRAMILCKHFRSDARTCRWLYEKQERSHTVQIVSQDKSGVKSFNKTLRSRIQLQENCSLTIDCLTEEDQGRYWCEVSFQDRGLKKDLTAVRIKKEIHNETQTTLYIAAGRSFTQACPGEFPHLKWTFEASFTTSNRNPKQARPYSVMSNKSLKILKVKAEHAGNYTCWTKGCHGHREKLLTINLYVTTESGNIETSSTSRVDTGTRTTTVIEASNGSSNYSSTQFSSEVDSTNGPANAGNSTTGTELKLIVVYGASAVLACLILTALLICYFRQRLRGVYNFQPFCCGWNHRVEEETPVVYSSIVIRKHDATRNYPMAQDDCVYSEIRR